MFYKKKIILNSKGYPTSVCSNDNLVGIPLKIKDGKKFGKIL